MTEEVWRQKARARILAVVAVERRISLRALKQRTHYARIKIDGGIAIWHEAVDALEREGLVTFEDRDGTAVRFADYFEGRLMVIASRKLKRPVATPIHMKRKGPTGKK